MPLQKYKQKVHNLQSTSTHRELVLQRLDFGLLLLKPPAPPVARTLLYHVNTPFDLPPGATTVAKKPFPKPEPHSARQSSENGAHNRARRIASGVRCYPPPRRVHQR